MILRHVLGRGWHCWCGGGGAVGLHAEGGWHRGHWVAGAAAEAAGEVAVAALLACRGGMRKGGAGREERQAAGGRGAAAAAGTGHTGGGVTAGSHRGQLKPKTHCLTQRACTASGVTQLLCCRHLGTWASSVDPRWSAGPTSCPIRRARLAAPHISSGSLTILIVLSRRDSPGRAAPGRGGLRPPPAARPASWSAEGVRRMQVAAIAARLSRRERREVASPPQAS